jgi:hypothetical protein
MNWISGAERYKLPIDIPKTEANLRILKKWGIAFLKRYFKMPSQ